MDIEKNRHLKNAKYLEIIENYFMLTYDFYMTAACNETVTQNTLFRVPATLLLYSALEIKRLILVGKILGRFGIILHMWLIQLLFH